jgi:hypothetical protein
MLKDTVEKQKREKVELESSHNAAMSELLDMKLEGMSSFSSPCTRGKSGRTSDPSQNLTVKSLQAQLADREAEVEELRRVIEERDEGYSMSDYSPTLDTMVRGTRLGIGHDEEDVTLLSLDEIRAGNKKDRSRVDDGSTPSESSAPYPIFDTEMFEMENLDLEHLDDSQEIPIFHRTPPSHAPNPEDLAEAVSGLYDGETADKPKRPNPFSPHRTASKSMIEMSSTPFYDMDMSRDEESCQTSPPKLSRPQGRPHMRSLPNLAVHNVDDTDEDTRVSTSYLLTLIHVSSPPGHKYHSDCLLPPVYYRTFHVCGILTVRAVFHRKIVK